MLLSITLNFFKKKYLYSNWYNIDFLSITFLEVSQKQVRYVYLLFIGFGQCYLKKGEPSSLLDNCVNNANLNIAVTLLKLNSLCDLGEYCRHSI